MTDLFHFYRSKVQTNKITLYKTMMVLVAVLVLGPRFFSSKFMNQGFYEKFSTEFIICWLPHHVLNLMILFKHDFKFTKATFVVKITSHCVSFCHGNFSNIHQTFWSRKKSKILAMINPILYGFMSEWMRKHLRAIWSGCCLGVN